LKKNQRPKNAQLAISVVIIVLIIFSGVMTVKALQALPVNSQEILKQSKTQRIIYDYQVFTAPSILYPEGSALPAGLESYFKNVINRIEFQVTGEIEVSPDIEPEGELHVSLFVRSPGQWEKELGLKPKTTVLERGEGLVRYSSNFTLPLEEAAALAEAIIEEIEVRPREGYSLVIKSVLSSNIPPVAEDPLGEIPPGEDPQLRENGDLTGEYEFGLSNTLIEPKGELLYETIEESRDKVSTTNYMSVFGLPLTVSTGRILFPSALAVFLLLGGISYTSLARKTNGTAGDSSSGRLSRIRKRYRSRIVMASGIRALSESSLKVEMESFKDLLKIADEKDTPVLQVTERERDGSEGKSAQFYVVDGETLYFYNINAD